MAAWLPIPFRVAVLGGGLSGLSAAHTVLKYAQVPTEVTVIESQSRVGGWLDSTRFEDGTVFEHGPRSARSYGNTALDALDMLSELGIDDQFIGVPKTSAAASTRFIYCNGDVLELPRGINLARKWGPLPKSLLSLGAREPFVKKKSDSEDESVYDFFQRRFRSKEIADYLCDPLCRGIFGGDSKKLSLRSCFPMLYDYEQNHGSIVKGAVLSKSKPLQLTGSLTETAQRDKWTAWTLRGGIQNLPQLWSEHLVKKGLAIHLNTSCRKLQVVRDENGRRTIHVHTDNDDSGDGTLEVDHVLSTVDAPTLSALARDVDGKVCGMLDSIEYATMAVVNLEYEKCTNPYKGFGYLVPSCEPLDVLGVTFDSQIFPQHATNPESSIVTVMSGGPRFSDLFGHPDKADQDKITELSVKTVRDTLGFSGDPVRHVTRVNNNCIPQYGLGHHALSQNIEKRLLAEQTPLTILGNMWGGAGVNDVIVNARNNTLKWLAANHLY